MTLSAAIGSDLKPRVLAGLVLGVAALATAWIGGLVFVAFWWTASVVVFWEWQRLIHGDRLIERTVVGAVTLALAAILAMHGSIIGSVAALAVGAGVVAWFAGRGSWGWAVGGTVYGGALVVSVALLRASPSYGSPAIFWLFAVVWGADVAAYFAGRLVGGPRLWPAVSPGKTWSGAIAGALAGAALGLLLIAWTTRLDRLFLLGFVTAIVSELGDLFESGLKRRFGVKDSSHIIPGHGGLMDRLDGFIAASAFAVIFAALNSQGSYIASGLFQW